MAGCQKPLFSAKDERSQFDRYDRSRNQYAAQYVEDEFGRKYLAWLLARADGSLSAAARMAHMDRKHLRNLAKKHGLWTG